MSGKVNPALSKRLRAAHQANLKEFARYQRVNKYRSPMFAFVRACRLDPDLVNSTAEQAAGIVEKTLRSWDETPPAVNLWRHWFSESPNGRLEFTETWDKLRAAGLIAALARAQAFPLKPTVRKDDEVYCRFLSVAYALQVERGNEPIFLSCHKLGKLLGCESMQTWRARNFAIEQRLLTRVRKSAERHLADEFRFDLEAFDPQTGMQRVTHEIHETTTTHESHEFKSTNKFMNTHESHESGVTHDVQRPKPKLYIPTADECALDLRQYRQRRYGRRPAAPVDEPDDGDLD